ncbi:hypothetical protein yruck0001_500 [Yersinia ruckeri ATCC 29473]|nr:hypothetical protein yruck0001_500 [Yersinia ruckeri ATCC 29473]
MWHDSHFVATVIQWLLIKCLFYAYVLLRASGSVIKLNNAKPSYCLCVE